MTGNEFLGQRRFRYYGACSVDGYIADASGGVDWLTAFDDVDYSIGTFYREVDTIVMGRATYEHGRKLMGGKSFGLPTFVLTSRTLDDVGEDIHRVESVSELSERLRSTGNKDIWVMGGGITASSIFDAGCLDTVELHMMPVVLGSGIPLFSRSTKVNLKLEGTRSFPNGVIGLSYSVVR